MVSNADVARLLSLAGRTLSARIVAGLDEYGFGRGEYRVLFAFCEEEGISRRNSVSATT